MRRLFGVWPAALILAAACSNRPPDPAKQTTKPTYDKTTGKLTQLTYDRNGNGVIDTWTDMDGASRCARASMRTKTAGPIDGSTTTQGKLVKVVFAQQRHGKPTPGVSRARRQVARSRFSSTGDEQIIDRGSSTPDSGLRV
jgi:hypothetical protein